MIPWFLITWNLDILSYHQFYNEWLTHIFERRYCFFIGNEKGHITNDYKQRYYILYFISEWSLPHAIYPLRSLSPLDTSVVSQVKWLFIQRRMIHSLCFLLYFILALSFPSFQDSKLDWGQLCLCTPCEQHQSCEYISNQMHPRYGGAMTRQTIISAIWDS